MLANKLIPPVLMLGLLGAPVGAQQPPPGIVGQDGWLYYRNEISTPADSATVAATLALVGKTNQVLERNGIALVVAMAPLKIRVHPENLPPSVKLDDHLKTQYARTLQGLRSGGVKAVDMNTAFVNSPVRIAPMPLYFKRDTHWSSAGALVAAESIRDAITADAVLKAAWDTAPVVPYTLAWSPKDWPMDGDLPAQLPKGSPSFDKELIKIFEVQKPANAGGGLLGGNGPAITLLGSSYTADWTNFPAAVRYALQRDVLSISVDASQGQWVGLHTYLRDDAFQTNRPKLMVWEMPERDMRAASDYPWREARYVMGQTEWLLTTSALVQNQCVPSTVTVKVQAATIAGAQGTANGFSAGATTPAGFIELGFDKPIGNLDYLSGKLTLSGAKTLTLEASGPQVATRKFTLPVAGDDSEHAFRAPVVSADGKGGFTRLRLSAGTAKAFAMQDLQLCRQPADLLN
jgi:alginate O-acetyltransferase complex protein AlgJ